MKKMIKPNLDKIKEAIDLLDESDFNYVLTYIPKDNKGNVNEAVFHYRDNDDYDCMCYNDHKLCFTKHFDAMLEVNRENGSCKEELFRECVGLLMQRVETYPAGYNCYNKSINW